VEEGDEDEHDRRQLEEIRRRIEVRRATKELEASRTDHDNVEKATPATPTVPTSDNAKTVDARVGDEMDAPGKQRTSTKVPRTPKELMSADIDQRKEARKWASESTSEVAMVPQSTTERGSGRQKGAKKASEKSKPMSSSEVAQSLVIQDFIAAQYPPIVDECVSSTVRLGRALVSGALGRKNDDPKLFEATVELQECSVVIQQSTKRKAKTLVSAAPPNSIDSEAEGEEHDDVRLSQSSTDTGVNIELPGCAMETDEGKTRVADEEGSTSGNIRRREEGAAAGPEGLDAAEARIVATTTASGEIANTVTPTGDSGAVTPLLEASNRKSVDTTSTPIVANEATTDERRRILRDIDAAELMRSEIAKTSLELASVSSFLGTVCGERRLTEKDKVVADGSVAKLPAHTGAISTGRSQEQEQRYTERQRLTRITAAQSLLKEELAKKNPVAAVVNAYRKAAGRAMMSRS